MEHYLQEKHAEEYMGLDDGMPEAFDAWMLDLDIDEWIKYADNYGIVLIKAAWSVSADVTKEELSKLTNK